MPGRREPRPTCVLPLRMPRRSRAGPRKVAPVMSAVRKIGFGTKRDRRCAAFREKNPVARVRSMVRWDAGGVASFIVSCSLFKARGVPPSARRPTAAAAPHERRSAGTILRGRRVVPSRRVRSARGPAFGRSRPRSTVGAGGAYLGNCEMRAPANIGVVSQSHGGWPCGATDDARRQPLVGCGCRSSAAHGFHLHYQRSPRRFHIGVHHLRF